MRILFLLLSVFFCLSASGQSMEQLVALNQKLSKQLKGKHIIQSAGNYLFHMDSDHRLIVDGNTENDLSIAIEKFIAQHKGLFQKKHQYNLNIFYDYLGWTRESYATFSSLGPIPDKPIAVFSNPGVPASVGGGVDTFLSLLREGLIQNYDSVKNDARDWYKPIELYIDKEGRAEFLPSNSLSKLVSELQEKKWQPMVRSGRPHDVILSIVLNKDSLFSDNILSFATGTQNFAMKLEDWVIKVVPNLNQRLPYSTTGISALYLPGEGFREARIIFGDVEDGLAIISLIEPLNVDINSVLFEDEPLAAKRIYLLAQGLETNGH